MCSQHCFSPRTKTSHHTRHAEENSSIPAENKTLPSTLGFFCLFVCYVVVVVGVFCIVLTMRFGSIRMYLIKGERYFLRTFPSCKTVSAWKTPNSLSTNFVEEVFSCLRGRRVMPFTSSYLISSWMLACTGCSKSSRICEV